MPRPSQCIVCYCYDFCFSPSDPDCAEKKETELLATMRGNRESEKGAHPENPTTQ